MANGKRTSEPDWLTCTVKGCIGIRLPEQLTCLAHAEAAGREAFLARLKPGAKLDLRGTRLRREQLAAVLHALEENGEPRLSEASFQATDFPEGAVFQRAQFRGGAVFQGARFHGDASFAGAQFQQSVEFNKARFHGDASFFGAQFQQTAEFDEAQFQGEASFCWAQFQGYAGFRGARFQAEAWFEGTQFEFFVGFQRAQFEGNAYFTEGQFQADAWFDGARFRHDAGFTQTDFGKTRRLGPITVEGELLLDRASFSAPILIEAATPMLSLESVDFQEAATLRLRYAQIILDGASFSKPSTISLAQTPLVVDVPVDEPPLVVDLSEDELKTDSSDTVPRLLSMRGVDVSHLVLADLDLSACLFQDAHNLEKLRLEGPFRFRPTPGPWRVRLGRRLIAVWRVWMPRQTLAEEHFFRVQRSGQREVGGGSRLLRAAWNPPAEDTVEDTTTHLVQTLNPESIAALYRALRKGLEDQRNAPAAADFYYGEMEMRRHSLSANWADRLVLWVYWLFSGYGLRASRAVVAFALVVPLFAMGFWLWGLDLDHGRRVSYWIALLRSFESATSLLRPSPPGLNELGQLIDAVLRLIGATLLGLALFSLRGRIRR